MNFSGDLEFQKVSFSYPGNQQATLSDVSFKISPGQFIAFVGPSGSGKSTILDLILGLQKPNKGKILIEGNWWKDTYWGVCDGKGQNKLGELLMKVRKIFTEEPELIFDRKEVYGRIHIRRSE